MKAIDTENKLREVVARLVTEVDLSARQGRLDVNLVSEDAWLPILREVFQCPNLENLNKEKKNFPGIDLGDEVDRVAFQVTSTTSLDKIKKTLETFLEKGYERSFDEVYVFTLSNKQKSYSQKAIDDITNGKINFDARRNVVDPGDILERITSLRLGVQSRLLEEFKVILGDMEEKNAALGKVEEVPHVLASNMIRISFPEFLYVAELSLDEIGIVERAKEQLNLKKNKVSKYTLIKLGLLLEGVDSNEWVYHENKLFTFHDLESRPGFDKVVEVGTVDKIEASYFYDSEFIDYHNLFKQLLKFCLKDILIENSVSWSKEEKMFYFMPTQEGEEVRKETWTGKKTASRTVYEKKYQKKEPGKLAHHRHLSFDAIFKNVDSEWYCVVNPSWLYTYNLYKKSFYHDDLLSSQKRLEFNQTVRNIIRFLAFFLADRTKNEQGFIQFHDLVEFEYLYPNIESEYGDLSMEEVEEVEA